MNEIKISLDDERFQLKPTGEKIPRISKRIGRHVQKLNCEDMKDFVLKIGRDGCTFCPSTFKNGIRNKENFEQQQLLALDFDNKNSDNKISFEQIKDRADYYELPVLFAYDTLSSTDHDKFRVVFLNDISIHDRKVAEAVQLAIGKIFPEADSSCYRDVSKIYYGGKNVLYYDDKIPTVNIESIFRNFTYCMKEKHKPNHYKEHILRFSKETGIALNKNGFLDVTVSDCLPETTNPIEASGVALSNQNGKNSPSSIVYELDQSNIIADGEIFPKIYYCINFNENSECTDRSSVGKTVNEKTLRNHAPCRSQVLPDMEEKCKLFREFVNGSRKLSHDELYGLATNLIQIETGSQKFLNTIIGNIEYYNAEKNNKWKYDLSYMKQNEYKPQRCNKYCPYCAECVHGKNIILTVDVKRGTMEKVGGCHEEFYSLEDVQNDTYHAICRAYHAEDKQFQIIKSMTAAGKSTSYLKLMSENPADRFLIAAPTNLLKDEIYEKACRMGMNVKKTPSLEQIKDEMPDSVRATIERLYKAGRHKCVHQYIYEILKKKDIPCLRKYMKAREKLKVFDGNVITTHRYLLNMDEKRLREYDAVIIDEDIIFKSVISNQEEITVRKLKKLLKKNTDRRLSDKIRKLLKTANTQSCIEMDGFEWDDEADGNDKIISFDIPSFCSAEKFYLRRESQEENLKTDTITFLKPVSFKDVKYIMVSATVSKDICCQYFGEDNVNFYECKKAAYKGCLKQYVKKSMSRTCLANNRGIIEHLMEKFDMDAEHVITFKKENIGSLHFGNTEGSNTLEGEDILVVGTPYHAEFLYKLAAFSLGMDFDEDEEMSLQLVTYNGYRFRFMTFEDEDLRAVHFWMIESELEQAVGRARLLRNDCNVHLFSNFPLSQSNIIDDFDYNCDND